MYRLWKYTAQTYYQHIISDYIQGVLCGIMALVFSCLAQLRPVEYLYSPHHEPLASYVKLRVAHAPGMPGTCSPPSRASDPDMHHGTYVTYVPWCMPGLLTSGFLWSRWWWKRSQYSRRMCNTQFFVSGKRPMAKMLDFRHVGHRYKLVKQFYTILERVAVVVVIWEVYTAHGSMFYDKYPYKGPALAFWSKRTSSWTPPWLEATPYTPGNPFADVEKIQRPPCDIYVENVHFD